jgi:Flp pilus assembly protein TadD
MAKPMLVTTPLLFLALDYWPLRRFAKQNAARPPARSSASLVLEKAPLLLLSIAAGVATLIAQKSTVGYGEQTPLLTRLVNASVASATYIKQMFWPANLTIFYPQPANGWPLSEISLSLGLLVLVSAAVIHGHKTRPYLVVGWLWYLVSLSPTLGLVPVGLQAHADRYTYLPQIGLYIAITWLASDVASRFPRSKSAWIIVGAAAIAALTWFARVQASSWRDTETLWKHAIAVDPNNDVANYNLALRALDRDRVDDAIRYLENALAGRADQETSSHLSTSLLHNVLGIALARKGRAPEAMVHYRKAVELRDNFADAHTNLATALLAAGANEEAIKHFRIAKDLPPEDAQSHLRLAAALGRTGHTEEALTEYRRAIFIEPRNPKAHYLLAKALDLGGNRDEARIEANRAVELDPSQPEFKALQEQFREK